MSVYMYVIFNDLELTRNLSTAACARQSRCTSFVKDPNLHVSRYTSTHLLLILFFCCISASFFIFFCFAFVLSFFQIKAQQTHENSTEQPAVMPQQMSRDLICKQSKARSFFHCTINMFAKGQ